MRAIQVTCPHCGARLNAGDVETITCEYCGTACRVQRRTRMLERVLPPTANGPAQIAVQTRSRLPLLIVAFAVLLPLAITGFVIWKVIDTTKHAFDVVNKTTAQTARAMSSAPHPRPEDATPKWQGTDDALVADVNQDGTPDIVGRGRRVSAQDIVQLVALDGTSGKLLWRTEPLGTYTETYRSPLAISGELVLFANVGGEVQAFAVATGKPVWKAALPEKINYLCEDGSGIVALTADNMLRPIARADGALGTPTKASPKSRDPRKRLVPQCKRLPTDDETDHKLAKHMDQISHHNESPVQKKLGVSDGTIVEGPGGRVLGAARATGTRITLLIGLGNQDNELWRTQASKQPLGSEGAPRMMAVSDREVCAVYSETTGVRLGCFSLADGTRLWDEPMPSFFTSLVVLGRSLLITARTGLQVHDLATGTLRWKTD